MATLTVPRFDPADQPFPVDRLNAVLEAVDADDRTGALVAAQNVNPVARLRYNDHGPKHIETVLQRAIELYGHLKAADVAFNGAADHGLDPADEPVIIALGAILHDVGHVVHRHHHSHYSVALAWGVLDDLLTTVYDREVATTIAGEVLHAIVSHHVEISPLTREAGVVRVADALDMERGRSRKPYERGGRGINTLSSQAIQTVSVRQGEEHPVDIEIEMTSAAGIYQVDELLRSKVEGSRIEQFVRIVAIRVDGDDRLVDRIEF
ncbi:MAG: HD domain-containing protein [Halobacteriota archaeon]